MTSVTQEPPAEPPPSRAGEPEPVPGPDEIAAELEVVEQPVDGSGDGTGDGEPVDGEDERRYPSTIGGAFYLLILTFCAIGIGIVWSGDWRLGVRCLAGGLCFAAMLRLVIPRRDAGMLAVRHRFVDAVLLGGVGAALFFLASTIPDQPA